MTLDRFADAVDAWRLVLDAVAEATGSGHVLGMTIEELAVGSALIVTSVTFDASAPAAAFSEGFLAVGAIARGEMLPEPHPGLTEAGRRLASVARREPAGLILATDDTDLLVLPAEMLASKEASTRESPSMEAYGELRGRLQSVSSRSGLRAVLYDEIFDKAVRLIVTADQHETLRALWDAPVVVEGVIRRDRKSARPLSMPEVREIRPDAGPEINRSWLDAYGVLAGVGGELAAEDLIDLARRG